MKIKILSFLLFGAVLLSLISCGGPYEMEGVTSKTTSAVTKQSETPVNTVTEPAVSDPVPEKTVYSKILFVDYYNKWFYVTNDADIELQLKRMCEAKNVAGVYFDICYENESREPVSKKYQPEEITVEMIKNACLEDGVRSVTLEWIAYFMQPLE